MLRVFGRVFHAPLHLWTAARQHPGRALLALLLLTATALVGVWGYAVREWRAAQAALNEERAAAARERVSFCLRVWPWSTEVHLLAARAARLTGDLKGAEAHLNRCLQLEGGATESVQLEFLLLRVQSGEVDDLAPALFEVVQRGHPDAPIILNTIAQAYIMRLRYKPAYACLSLWIEKYPEEARPYQLRGWVLERLNNQKAAMADYQRALELDPDLIPVRLRVVEMYLEDKQVPEALPHLEVLYRQAPDNMLVQARLGMCRFHQGRSEEARRLMEAAVGHLPHDPALLVALAGLDLQEGGAADAERRLRAVLATDPADTEALFVLSSALQLLGRSEEAAAVLADYNRKRAVVDRIHDLLKDVADSPTAGADDYAEIGRLFFELGRNKFGTYWSERALELDPLNQPAHTALAAHYDRQGEPAKAAVHRRQLRGTGPASTPSTGVPGGPGQ